MARTPSVRNGTTAPNIKHNLRLGDYWAKHINPQEKNIVIKARKENELPEIYDRIYGEAVQAYDAKQKDKRRKIGNYYAYLLQQNVRNEGKRNKQIMLEREIIATIGDKTQTTRDDLQVLQALARYARQFEQRNPNLVMTSAIIHRDEQGAPHLHLTFVPVAHDKEHPNKLQLRNSWSAALNEMGYTRTPEKVREAKLSGKRGTAAQPQCQWARAEANALYDIAKSCGIADLQHEGTSWRRHLDTQSYKALQEEIENTEKKKQKIENNIGLAVAKGRIEVDKLKAQRDDYIKQTAIASRQLAKLKQDLQEYGNAAGISQRLTEVEGERNLYKQYIAEIGKAADFDDWAAAYRDALDDDIEQDNELDYGWNYEM